MWSTGVLKPVLAKRHQEDSDDGRDNGCETQRGNLLLEKKRGEQKDEHLAALVQGRGSRSLRV